MDPGPLMLWWFGQGSVFHSVSGNGQYKRMPILLTIQTTDHCSKHRECFMHIYLCNYQLKIICTDQCSNHSECFMHIYCLLIKIKIYIYVLTNFQTTANVSCINIYVIIKIKKYMYWPTPTKRRHQSITWNMSFLLPDSYLSVREQWTGKER